MSMGIFLIFIRILILAGCVASWGANGFFGFQQHPVFSIATGFAVFVVLMDIFKSFVLMFLPKGKKLTLEKVLGYTAVLSYYVLATCLSLLSAAGLYAWIKDSSTGDKNAVKEEYQLIKSRIDNTKKKLARIGRTRSVGVLKAEITAAKAQRRWASTKGCKPEHITAQLSREFCSNLAKTKGELENASLVAIHEAQVSKLEAKLQTFDLATVNKSSDAQVEMLSKNFDMEKGQFTFMVSMLIAVVSELLSGAGFFIIKSGRDHEKEALKRNLVVEQQAVRAANAKAKTAKKKAVATLKNAKDLNGVERFLRTQTTTSPRNHRGYEKISDLHDAYQIFCDGKKGTDDEVIEPLKKNDFAAELKKRNYESFRLSSNKDPKRPTVYRGLALLPNTQLADEFGDGADLDSVVVELRPAAQA